MYSKTIAEQIGLLRCGASRGKANGHARGLLPQPWVPFTSPDSLAAWIAATIGALAPSSD